MLLAAPRARDSRPPVTTPERQRDAEFVAAMARGDRGAALESFYARFAGLVTSLCVRILGSRTEAEDLVQEIVVELWRRAPDYDPARAAVSTWVVTVARSRALDRLRARQRRQADQQVPVEDATLPAPATARPDAQAVAGQRSAAVHRALVGLGPEQRKVLELAFFDGLSHSEIAVALGQPLGTVKSRILSAMRVLRAGMADHAGGDEP